MRAVRSVRYLDEAGTLQTVDPATYHVWQASRRFWITPKDGECWPDICEAPGAVQVEYETGFDEIPATVVQALRMLVAHWYENRQDEITGAVSTNVQLGVKALTRQIALPVA